MTASSTAAQKRAEAKQDTKPDETPEETPAADQHDETAAGQLEGETVDTSASEAGSGSVESTVVGVSQPLDVPPETYTDSHGIERLAGNFDDGWEHPSLDPDPALVEFHKNREKEIEAKARERDERLHNLKSPAARADEEKAKSDAKNEKKDES